MTKEWIWCNQRAPSVTPLHVMLLLSYQDHTPAAYTHVLRCTTHKSIRTNPGASGVLSLEVSLLLSSSYQFSYPCLGSVRILVFPFPCERSPLSPQPHVAVLAVKRVTVLSTVPILAAPVCASITIFKIEQVVDSPTEVGFLIEMGLRNRAMALLGLGVFMFVYYHIYNVQLYTILYLQWKTIWCGATNALKCLWLVAWSILMSTCIRHHQHLFRCFS